MVSIRRGGVEDLLHMQNANLWCLPENYQCVGLVLNDDDGPPSTKDSRGNVN